MAAFGQTSSLSRMALARTHMTMHSTLPLYITSGKVGEPNCLVYCIALTYASSINPLCTEAQGSKGEEPAEGEGWR